MLENYTNLSEYFLLTSVFVASAAFAVGIVIAFRLLPIFRQSGGHKLNQTTSSTLDALPASDVKNLAKGQGRLRKSEILGFDGTLIRYRDGSFGKAYRITLANSIYQSEEFTENRIDEISSLLNFDKPAGTVIQIRYDCLPGGNAHLRKHLRFRHDNESHPHAALLHATNIKIYEDAVAEELIKEQSATVWIRVPASDASDHPALLQFLPSITREIRRGGFFQFLTAPILTGKNAFSLNFVRREKEREEKCKKEAEKVFRSFEENFPRDLRL